MINDFISVYDNSFTSDECEEYINLIEHYIINGVITKEDRAYHNTDHFSLNFNRCFVTFKSCFGITWCGF